MSRRKQLKPRAVKCDENDEEMTEIELEKTATEIMEEDGLKSDQEEDLKDEQNEDIKLEIDENNKNDAAECKKNHNEILSTGSIEIIDKYENNSSNDLSLIEIKEENIIENNNNDNNENKNQIDEDNFNMDSEKEQDENLDELMSSQDDINSSDSFYSDYYSTHTSLSYSPSSISEEATTANSIHRFYTPEPRPEGEGNAMENLTDPNVFKGDEVIAPTTKKRQTRNSDAKVQPPQKLRKIDKNLDPTKNGCDNSKNSLESSYQCQFCEKSFPRLGYLKKHEQSHAEHLPFKCEYCARLFKHKRSRDRHTKLHTGDRRYKCPHCEAAFSRSDHLKIHMKTHDNQKPFQCTVCNRGYNTAAALTSHMQNHKKQKNLLTKDGRDSYSPESTGSASSNKYIQQKNKYKYGTMAAPSPLASDQTHNHKNIHNENKNNKFYCVYCTKSDFGSVEQLNTHVQQIHHNVIYNTGIRDLFKVPQSHSNIPLNCEFCSMKFANIPTMFQHIQSAHKDKIFNRTLFGNEFNRHLELEKSESHILTPRSVEEFHKISKFNEGTVNMEKVGQRSASLPSVSEQKDEEQSLPTDLSQPDKRSQSPKICVSKDNVGMFLCNQCNAALPDFNTFCNHLKTHINPYGVSLTCPQCGLNLHDSDEMDRHYTSHFLACTSVFLCDMNCKKTFKTSEELQNHLFDTHAQVMYKCSICLDLFNSKSAVQIHFSTTHFIEKKIYQCSACKETFDYEKELLNHIKTRHQIQSGSIQCMFCRVICKSELEMHFHLAEHSRQFRCPNCPETFHVEFLLDRHIKTQHLGKDQIENGGPSTPISSEMNGLYYKVGCRQGPGNSENNLSPNANLKINMNAKKHSNLLYDMNQGYFDPNKSLLLNRIYNYNSERSSFPPDHNSYRNFFIRPEFFAQTPYKDVPRHPYPNEDKNKKIEPTVIGFSCGICDRNDFKNEVEVHSHRKIAHNFKTGVSLRCAYCNDVFKSRTELENHMKNCHNSTGKHKCLICDEIFPSPAILAEHKLQHSKVGQSGVCSYCYMPLNDFSVFKIHMTEHNIEGQIPAECICCRQTLNSDFEIGLHAKFHTKTSEVTEGNECALCLVAIPITSETRICEKCRKKHNLSFKLNKVCYENTHQLQNENHCNICKTVFPTFQRLREHLIEHTFYGCEDRGYTCYICSAVFVAPALLLSHINKHGHESKPYDCSLCFEKFFFRAELDNHRIEHENRKEDSSNFRIELKELKTENKDGSSNSSLNSNSQQEINTADREGNNNDTKEIEIVDQIQSKIEDIKNDIKTEKTDEIENDDEYIEVEKVMESKLNESNAEMNRKLE